jgi:hypothetical protein
MPTAPALTVSASLDDAFFALPIVANATAAKVAQTFCWPGRQAMPAFY